MENTNRKYTSLVKKFSTRVMYHAHMEQHSRMATTEVMVITMLVVITNASTLFAPNA